GGMNALDGHQHLDGVIGFSARWKVALQREGDFGLRHPPVGWLGWHFAAACKQPFPVDRTGKRGIGGKRLLCEPAGTADLPAAMLPAEMLSNRGLERESVLLCVGCGRGIFGKFLAGDAPL